MLTLWIAFGTLAAYTIICTLYLAFRIDRLRGGRN